MTYNISSFGVINILVYGDWGSNFNTCPNMVNEVKKNAKRIFFYFGTSELQKPIKISLQTTCAHGTTILNIFPRTTKLNMLTYFFAKNDVYSLQETAKLKQNFIQLESIYEPYFDRVYLFFQASIILMHIKYKWKQMYWMAQ